MFNVESEEELMQIDQVARETGIRASVALRINPDIDPETHPYIATGLKRHKFGIPIEEALEYYKIASSLKHINVIGIHKHIGSQITKVSPFVEALQKILLLIDKLVMKEVNIQYLDVGGMREKPIKLCHRGIGGVIGIRVSNHFTNTKADIDYLVEMQKKLI